jgi:hypothetical protein
VNYTLAFSFAAMLAMTSLATFAGDDGSIAFWNADRERCHGAVNLKHAPHIQASVQNHFDATVRSGCVPIMLPMLPSSS